MAAPAIIKQVGTGAAYWLPDTWQVPFQISLAAVFSGATGTATVDVTWDDISGVMDVNGVGTSNATWWNIVALTSTNASANFTTPVSAFRVFMQTAVATSVVTVTFLQGVAGKF